MFGLMVVDDTIWISSSPLPPSSPFLCWEGVVSIFIDVGASGSTTETSVLVSPTIRWDKDGDGVVRSIAIMDRSGLLVVLPSVATAHTVSVVGAI